MIANFKIVYDKVEWILIPIYFCLQRNKVEIKFVVMKPYCKIKNK